MPNIARLLTKAINLAGSQGKLARLIGTSQNAVYKALREQRVSAEMAAAIHRALNGEVSAWELRPDLWSKDSPPAPTIKYHRSRKSGAPPPAATAE